MSNNYTVLIERVGRPRFNFHGGGGRLRFEIMSSRTVNFDPNNNDGKQQQQSSRKLASFELMEDGISSIKVLPIEQSFNVECIKSNGPPSAEMSNSVQVIHLRNGTLNESNENVTLVYLQPDKNLMGGANALTPLSTFQCSKKTGGSNGNSSSVTSISDVIITEEDLRTYTRFSLKFMSVVDSNSNCEGDDEMVGVNGNIEELPSPIHHHSTKDNDTNSTDNEEYGIISAPELYCLQDGTKINLQASFDDAISITIELQNLFYQTTNPHHQHFGASNDLYFIPQNNAVYSESQPKFRDLHEVSKARAILQQRDRDTIQVHQNPLRSPWHKSSIKAHLVRKFIKSIVKHRLQNLGIQHLDCNEIIDHWESKHHNPFFFNFPDDEDEEETYHTRPNNQNNNNNNNNLGLISPFISKPNSDLFQLSPSGHITKSIFSTFVNQVESLKGILNNATCNLVHTSVCLLLPEIKLLWGRQLDTNRNPVFIHEWARLILLAGIEMKPVSPEEVIVMINRELKTLKTLTKELYKCSKKVFGKIESLTKFSEDIFRKTLAQLNPKSLKKLDAFDNSMKKKYSPDVIHFDPDQLHKIKISPSDLFRDHLFFSENSNGELLIKNDIDGFWGKFMDLEFVDRRTIFLGMSDDLQTTLRACIHTIQHLQEIYTAGYPGSIKNLLKDVVEELKFTSKRDDLTLIIKTSIVTHVSCLHEMLTRLLNISQEVKGISKQFNECLTPVSIDLKKMKRQIKKREKKTDFSDTDTSSFSGNYHYNNVSAGIRNSNAQLVIPFSSINVGFLKSQNV